MALPPEYRRLEDSEHIHPASHKKLNPTAAEERVTVTLFVRRRPGQAKVSDVADFATRSGKRPPAVREEFAARHGADPRDLQSVAEFARAHDLTVDETNAAARSVVVTGTVKAVNRAFSVQLQDYDSPRGKYRGHEGPAQVPGQIADLVEGVTGLDNRKVPAQHFSTVRRRNPADPVNTRPLTPQQVAQLYNFPDGDGASQTIGIYEMETQQGPAGYDPADIAATMKGFGLPAPQPIDVAVDGVGNSGSSDGETGLDITVAGAVAPSAQIAVYFTGGTTQSIIHALQRMIHPGPTDPVPQIISISYGWGPDDASAHSFSKLEYTQIGNLFQDAANLNITVLVSSGDSGAFLGGQVAQTSYPATEPWVIACGGTTIGNISGATFDEFVWNDTGAGGPGATGGGVSARFPLPDYQKNAGVPTHNGNNKPGRGVPDIAGNASENSGYMQFIGGGQPQSVGGTSAVAPLYAGLIARINSNLGRSVGFINHALYGLAAGAFRDIVGPPGPANNSFQGVSGYPAVKGWDACTGLGSVNGKAVQSGL